MKPIERRVKVLEDRTGQGGDTVCVVFRFLVSPDAPDNRRLAHARVIGGDSIARGDDESPRAFLERVAAAYEPVHGPVPDDWYERNAA